MLGDRIRMHDHATDPGVFIRSMASRGHLGGLAATTPQAVRILEAAGCDVVIVETVGVGQSEVEVASTADSTLVLLAPGMGDGIQAAKAGIALEYGESVVDEIARLGYDPAYGARPLKRVIQQQLQNALARELLGGEFVEGDRVAIAFNQDEFTFTKLEPAAAG